MLQLSYNQQNMKLFSTGPLTSAGGILLTSFLSNYNIQDNLPDHSVYFMDTTQAHASRIGLKREVRITQHLLCK